MTREMLGVQFTYNEYVLKANTDGMTQEEGLISPEAGGNCVNWVFGHILSTRNSILELLDEEPIWGDEEAERYGRGSAPILRDEEAVPLERMIRDQEISQQRIQHGLRRLDPERLSDPVPSGLINREGETLASLLAGLVFHESYHAGQTGILRRVIGKEGRLT